jgi:FeS assembly SUF system protein
MSTHPTASGSHPAVTEDQVINVLRTIYDPEIPVNIHEMGLIYGVRIGTDGVVDIDMTLTSPNCPAAASLPAEVKSNIEHLDGVIRADVQIVWDPPWTPDRMSEAAKLELGID